MPPHTREGMDLREAMRVTEKLTAPNQPQRRLSHAAQIIAQAAKEGCPEAILRMALLHERGTGVQRDLSSMIKYAKMGCDLGDDYCMLKMGHCLVTGNGIEQDVVAGLSWYEKAARLGNAIGRSRVKDIKSLLVMLADLFVHYDSVHESDQTSPTNRRSACAKNAGKARRPSRPVRQSNIHSNDRKS